MFRKVLKKILGRNEDASRKPGVVDQNQGPRFERAGEYPYDHYTDAVDQIKKLKRERRHEEAEQLLLWCIDFTETEARQKYEPNGGWQVAPWYYEHLAIVYRKEKRYDDEVAVLRRYVEMMDYLGISPKQKLVDRFQRARELASG